MSKKCNHEDFLTSLKAAPQDVSLPILQDYLSQGYTDYQWNTSPSATDAACLMKDGERGSLEEFLQGLVHAAPFFEKTHVACHCSATISGPGLPDVVVGAFGVQ